MKQRRLGIFLSIVVTLISLSVVFVGCDWFSSDDNGGSSKTSKYVFVANTDNSSISVFKILDNGALLSVDNVVLAAESYPTDLALSPNGKFLYVVNSNATGNGYGDNASISAYQYDSKTGAITEIEGSPFAAPIPGESDVVGTYINLAITPNGKLLYVTDQENYYVHIFKIESTGALTFLDSVYTDDAHGIAMHPSGKFLFVGSESGEIHSYVLDPDGDGSLSEAPNSPYAADGSYVWLAVNPNGKYLYGAGVDYGAAFTINTSTGELTGLADGVVDVSSDQPKSVVVSYNGAYLYSANFQSGTLGEFKIVSGLPDNDTYASIPSGKHPKSVTVTRSGEYVYVANYGDSTVTAFCITRSTGEMELLGTYPVGAGPKFLTALP